MKKNAFILILLFSELIYSQKVKIQILNQSDNNPIENVQIFSDSTLIDNTNKKGYFHIDKNKFTNITLVKEDYYDTIININSFKNIIYLKKIDAIILKEIIVTNLNINTILDSIYKNVKLKNIQITQNTHFFNSLTRGKDTLLFINNRLVHKNKVGDFCENINKIINNYRITNDNRVIYTMNNNEITFNNSYLHIGPPASSFELQIAIKLRKYFDYTVSKSDGFYKIDFIRKKNNNEFPYKGYLIIDRDDFGLYEFSCKTITDNKSKRNLTLNGKIINFKILNEESFIKYFKNSKGKYELISYSFDSELHVLDGYFKNSIFTNKCRKEPTNPFNAPNLKKINLLTYKFLE